MTDIWHGIAKAWDIAWPVIVAGGGISVLIQIIKKEANTLKESTIDTLVWVFSFLTALTNYLLTSSDLPKTMLGFKTAAIIGVVNIVYKAPFIGIKSLSAVVRDAKAQRAGQQTTTVSATQVVTPTEVKAEVTQTVSPATPLEFSA